MNVLAAASIAEQFGLEPMKVAAQVLIFAAVYLVLKRFAFGPVLSMLEARRKRIADGEAKLEKIARDLSAAEANAKVTTIIHLWPRILPRSHPCFWMSVV